MTLKGNLVCYAHIYISFEFFNVFIFQFLFFHLLCILGPLHIGTSWMWHSGVCRNRHGRLRLCRQCV